jgi:DNA-binding response OmpR family regulator
MGPKMDLHEPAAIIMLLDSERVMRASIRDALEEAGYMVITAGDLGKAVDRLEEMRPDLLITRPYINSMPGWMAAEYLRTRRNGLPVLIVAGFMEDDRTEVRNAIQDFFCFPPPFRRADLLAEVKKVLDQVRSRS